MLAQNFKTPADLQITDAEFDALVKVLGMLEREEIAYAPSSYHDPNLDSVPQFFNMLTVDGIADCGTTGCICGWARHVGGDRLLFLDRPFFLDDLFCMASSGAYRGRAAEDILPHEAAIALRNYLTHGKPRWNEALT
jgi:hypothetical protein